MTMLIIINDNAVEMPKKNDEPRCSPVIRTYS